MPAESESVLRTEQKKKKNTEIFSGNVDESVYF